MTKQGGYLIANENETHIDLSIMGGLINRKFSRCVFFQEDAVCFLSEAITPNMEIRCIVLLVCAKL